ncbi:hypothetical protein AB6D16_009170 [Vibrio cyclitrophicus]
MQEFCQKNPLLSDRGDHVYCKTSATKGIRDSRTFLCPVDLHYEIKNFAESFRLELVPSSAYNKENYKESTKLFLSTKTGEHIKPGTINNILKPYGINPHDSRKVGLTEICMGLIEMDYSEQECLFILNEIAGHSIKSEGKTVKEHYLLAQEMLNESVPNSVTLKYQLGKAEREIEELKRRLAEQNQ